MADIANKDTPARAQDSDPFEGFLCFSIYSASLAFNRAYKPILDRLGLTYVQYLAIVALGQRDGQTVGELGRKLFLESSTLTPLIKRLEASGLVSRTRDSGDERVVRVALTERGRAVARDASCVPAEIFAATKLSPGDLQRMDAELKRLRETLREGMTG
jgi:DNA-binding MarR family transcriptional regulator